MSTHEENERYKYEGDEFLKVISGGIVGGRRNDIIHEEEASEKNWEEAIDIALHLLRNERGVNKYDALNKAKGAASGARGHINKLRQHMQRVASLLAEQGIVFPPDILGKE